MTVEQIFLTEAADKLTEDLDRIDTCVNKLPAEWLWARESENENAVANLLLHLEGNLRQWIRSAIGGAPDTRHRPAEFSARSGATGPVLVANLRGVVPDAVRVIRTQPHARLVAPVSIQGYDTTVLAAIFHVVEHFSGHTYQVILQTKRATHEDLGFYGYLAETGRRGAQPSQSVPQPSRT